MATQSSTLAWKIQWTEELGELQSMGSQKSDQIEQLSAHTHSLPTKMLISSKTLSQTYQK